MRVTYSPAASAFFIVSPVKKPLFQSPLPWREGIKGRGI
jgi:hypothetical protein